MDLLLEALLGAFTLALFVGFLVLGIWFVVSRFKRRSIAVKLKQHFRLPSLQQVAVTERIFPVHIRADLQRTVNEFFSTAKVRSFHGVNNKYELGGVTFAMLLDESFLRVSDSVVVGPPQYEQIDVGEDDPVQVLQNGLWLLGKDGSRFAVLYSPLSNHGFCASHQVRLQIAVAGDDVGTEVARQFFRHVEKGVLAARCYRGKVLSFEQESSYTGQATGVKVHRLSAVRRDEVILPASAVDLLDRNVLAFVGRRDRLRELKMSTKKGLLFYGPPGTGKTHTIRYLAAALAGHTTLLISAEQVGLLGEYMTLARLLQPSIVVMEDVDLLARERTHMRNAATEMLLNKLLNEMDGLREDADVLFILTTNRPEELESALSSRPGRIDQAIEFPLPDDAGREKLVRLYSRGLAVGDELVTEIVKRTHNVSASFIKELMRRAAQFRIERNGSADLSLDDVVNALDEMLFSGGSLNLKLLGAEARLTDE